MYKHNFWIAARILLSFLVLTQGTDNYTDENRPYEFGFEVEVEGTKQQHRHEEKGKDGIIKGEFGFITADDVYHVTVYATDKDGHFKILSMKNIHLKSTTTSASGTSTSPRQGHALGLPASTKSPVTLVTSAPAAIPGVQLASKLAAPFQSQAVPTLTNNYPPQKTVALKPQTSFIPVPETSPVRACSACSLPTSPKPPPPVLKVSNIYQNQQNLFAPAPPSVNNLQSNSGSQPIRSNAAPNNPHLGPTIVTNTQSQPQQQNEAPEYPRYLNQQLNGQLPPHQSAYHLQESPSIQQAIQPSLTVNPQQEVSIADREQNYPNQQSQSSYPLQIPSVSNKAGLFTQQPSQSSYPEKAPLVQPNPQQTSQSTYPVQGVSAPGISQPNFPQTSQSSYAGQGPLVQPNPQQTSQSTYPVQRESAPGFFQPNFPQTSQSSYTGGPFSLASIQPTEQQTSQTIYPAGGDSGGRATLEQSNQSTYPIHESSIAGSGQPNFEQQGVFGERAPKQYNGPKEIIGPGQQGPVKPKLVSVDMQIVDKNTDIHALKHGEKEGLPDGLSEHDMSRLLYTFNYTVGFHGHFEEGFENGAKKGYYYVTGRNGVRTRIDYVADGSGFHPKVSQEVLDLLSDDVPKPQTEKDAKYGLKSYEFKWLYYPVGS